MIQILLKVCSEMVKYISSILSAITNPARKHICWNHRHGESNKEKEKQDASYSRWQNIQADIMETIVQRLKRTDLVRIGAVCKTWRQIVLLHKDIWITLPDIPWLMLPRAPDRKSLSFYSMSEGRVYNMKRPRMAQRGWVCGYTKGWLVIVKGLDSRPHMFLLNLVTGKQLNLPSLATINPYYDRFVGVALSHYRASNFVDKVEVFFPPGTSDCIVAAVFCICQVLAFCRPGDRKWTIYKGGYNGGYLDILFYEESLYTLTTRIEVVVSTRNIPLADCELKLKLIPFHNFNAVNHVWEAVENQPGLVVCKDIPVLGYLAESIHGELLMIRHVTDILAVTGNGEVGFWNIRYYDTKGFEIFKVNPNSGHLEKLTSLGEQVLLLATGASSFAVSVKNMESDGFKGNCVYFVAATLQKLSQHRMDISRESGVFYLEDGKIERSFPSFSFPVDSQMSWFTPFLH